MPGVTQSQRTNNLRTGLLLAAIALLFFLVVILKYYWLNN